tara:strand:- start:862 stop:1155 length:294 start_codon:yes stop_codon:yes gene_type:complete
MITYTVKGGDPNVRFRQIGLDKIPAWAVDVREEKESEMSIEDGGPAFPIRDFGMTLRDHFAGLAMQALIHVQVKTAQPQTAKSAYEWAAAMLEERKK